MIGVRFGRLGWNWLELVDGHLPAPEGPGLGVELDEAACERYKVE